MISDIELSNYVIPFKSYPDNYNNELSGKKSNTIRKIDETDNRFYILKQMHDRNIYGVIQIERNPKTIEQQNFGRQISNITYFEDYVVISWANYTPDYHQGWKDGFLMALKEVEENVKVRANQTEQSYNFYLTKEEVSEDEKRNLPGLQRDKIPDKT